MTLLLYHREVRGKWYAVLATLGLIGVVAGGLLLLLRVRERPEPAPPKPPPAALAAEVSLTGRILAANNVEVAVPVEGTLESLEVEAGAEVFEGQLLARIRNSSLQSERDRAQEDLERARTRVNNLESVLAAGRLEASRAAADAGRTRSEFERAERAAQRQQMLYREGATSRIAHEKAQKELLDTRQENDIRQARSRVADERIASVTKDLDAARRTLEEKTAELEDTENALLAGDVLSPVDGTVIAVKVAAGEQVTPAMGDFIRIAVDLSAMLLVLEPEPPLLKRILPRMPVAIQIAEVPELIQGVVREVKDSQVIAEFTSPSPAIKPGMTAQARLRME